MKCFFHPSEQAVAYCVDCHKPLCRSCASKYVVPICEECNRKRKAAEAVSYIKPLAFCVILFAIGCNVPLFGPDRTMGGYMCMSVYAGWKVINQFMPAVFVSFRSLFWYYLIRFAVAMFIGALVTPFYLIYCIFKLVYIMVK